MTRVLFRLKRSIFSGNACNVSEFAGAFGDLGTLIPFVVGYIVISGIEPVGLLVSLGLLMIYVGLRFKTPLPVQPMKAIGAAAIANPQTISAGMVWGSGLFTGIVWVILSLSGAVEWLNKITAKPVMRGIMLGLGISFILQGLKMMSHHFGLAIVALVIAFLLLASKRVPAILVLLCLGIVASAVLNPDSINQLKQISFDFKVPELVLGKMEWRDFVLGALILGIAQVPLTLCNAVLGTVAEHNELFPHRPVTVKTVALSHGLMNIFSFIIGGIPVCHGAVGLASYVRFGAKTGGALVILGVIFLVLGLFFGQSVLLLFNLIPLAILGVMLFFAGLELASIVWDIDRGKEDIYVLVITTGIAIINMGMAFVAGLALYYAVRRKIVKV